MKSSWDNTKSQSQYHFDTTIMDPKYDGVIRLGHIDPTWKQDLPDIISKSKPATWATRGYKGEGIEIPSEDLKAEQHDIAKLLADGTLYASDNARALGLAARSAKIDDELLAALERWEALGAPA